MLFIFRLIIVVIYCILVCIFGCIYCLFSPRNPKHVATFGHLFGKLSPVFGLSRAAQAGRCGKLRQRHLYR